jgi:hypothetical protein
MSDPFTIPTATPPARRPPLRREVLWNELELLHAQLQLLSPTQTYILEDLEATVVRLRAQVEEQAA